MPEDQTQYNIVTLKNIDDEDFIFAVNKTQYVIPAGEIRRFPKFMATLGYKHLVDKLLIKEDPEGRALTNQKKRDEIGSKILVDEKEYERPQLPTDAQILEEMNRPSEMDRLLDKNRSKLETQEDAVVTTDEDIIIPEPEVGVVKEEKFEGLETEITLPSRAEMMTFAKDVLFLNVGHHMTQKRLAKLSDTELYVELGMGN